MPHSKKRKTVQRLEGFRGEAPRRMGGDATKCGTGERLFPSPLQFMQKSGEL